MDPELNAAPPTDTPAADTATEQPAAAETSLEADLLAAMDEGIASQTEAAPTEPKAEPVAAAKEADPIPGTPEAAAAEAAKLAAEQAKPQPDEATETEITALGLKEKASERFRELTGEVKALAPVKEALEKAGIKDVAQLPELVQHAADYKELIGMVQETGATPEQYGMTLDYLKVINAANSGDRAAAERAYEMVSGELASLAKLIGKEVPGVHDPLAAHADIQQMLAAGEVTREAALEIAQLRQAQVLDRGRVQIEAQRNSQQTEHQNGIAALNTLGAELSADPQYAQKAPILIAALQAMKETVPPSRWAQSARDIYARIPDMPAPVAAVAAPVAVKPTPGPVRGNSVRPAVMAVTDDPFEAMDRGIAAASGG
jgi:hypothetical protein